MTASPAAALLAAALDYARQGVPVVPLHTPLDDGRCSCRRPHCDRPGKHPRLRHGLTDASTDPQRLHLWWSTWPQANIGLRTGLVMDVADLDTAGAWATLGDLGGPLARTGSGGWHVWVRPTGAGNRVRVLPGLDWRGAGGYVVAPPSLHACGRRYRWRRRPGPVLPHCPPQLYELVTGPPPGRFPAPPRRRPPTIHHPDRYAAAALRAATERVAMAVVGERNDTLNRAAYALGRLVAAGLLDPHPVRQELTAAALHAGLSRGEVARTVRSGLTAGIRHGSPGTPGRDAAGHRAA